QSPSRQKVLINEVAWMGGSGDFGLTSTDEWIELKNVSGAEIDVGNWQLIDKTEQIKINLGLLRTTKLKAGEFVLLERTDDGSAPNVPADLIYSNSLNNGDEGLRLFDDQCGLIDEVMANPDWPAGDNEAKKTMERLSDLSWHTYNGAAQNNVFGTPKKENSAPTVISSGGGGGASTNNQQQATSNQPAKILISEIQTSPTNKRFIELYNPNDSAVDLTGWYMQRKTQSGTGFTSLISKTHFENKTIPARGYFLISRDSLNGSDIVLDNLTLTESNAIQIKNQNGEAVDKAGWGGANDCEGNCAAEPPSGQSIQRKFTGDNFIDTDGNAQDFEIQSCPSPKAQSQTCPA
ncbi:MAG: lamin tail domain-containing protein, partial [Parcubacteria group bacterium]|nr:lamin tail domain-containing protein [Parcubacteria group bacterium]